jgi:hypothetical protein
MNAKNIQLHIQSGSSYTNGYDQNLQKKVLVLGMQ